MDDVTEEFQIAIAGLMLLRQNLDKHAWSKEAIDGVMRRIMMRGTPQDAKRLVPEAYTVCFPTFPPPKVTADYGKYTK